MWLRLPVQNRLPLWVVAKALSTFYLIKSISQKTYLSKNTFNKKVTLIVLKRSKLLELTEEEVFSLK